MTEEAEGRDRMIDVGLPMRPIQAECRGANFETEPELERENCIAAY